MDLRRLFFALEARADWLPDPPSGRLTVEEERHLTLAFLGEADFEALLSCLEEAPELPFKVGFAGVMDRCLFLPPGKPRVVAYHMEVGSDFSSLEASFSQWKQWLIERGFTPSHADRPLLPHITVCRSPFHPQEWKKHFSPQVVRLGALHLYESVGNLRYTPRWTKEVLAPFEERGSAFIVRGESWEQLGYHGWCALAYKFPALIPFGWQGKASSLEDVVEGLNEVIYRVDSECEVALKAVAYTGDIIECEMAIDV